MSEKWEMTLRGLTRAGAWLAASLFFPVGSAGGQVGCPQAQGSAGSQPRDAGKAVVFETQGLAVDADGAPIHI